MTEAEVNQKLGDRIKQVRRIRKLTQQQLRERTRLKSGGGQSLYEAGKRGLTVYRLLQMSQVLRVPVSCWFTDDVVWDAFCKYLVHREKP